MSKKASNQVRKQGRRKEEKIEERASRFFVLAECF